MERGMDRSNRSNLLYLRWEQTGKAGSGQSAREPESRSTTNAVADYEC